MRASFSHIPQITDFIEEKSFLMELEEKKTEWRWDHRRFNSIFLRLRQGNISRSMGILNNDRRSAPSCYSSEDSRSSTDSVKGEQALDRYEMISSQRPSQVKHRMRHKFNLLKQRGNSRWWIISKCCWSVDIYKKYEWMGVGTPWWWWWWWTSDSERKK